MDGVSAQAHVALGRTSSMTKGGCLCGAVRYEVSSPALFGANCYCLDCRKISSSHSAVMGVPIDAVKVTGELREYSSPGDSGAMITRSFCPTCGTGLFSKGARPGVMIVKAGTLDEGEHFKPMASVYASRAPSWDRPPEGLPAFEKMPPQA
jgi:hypothetical protein